MKDKNHMIILFDVEKAFDKIQCSFMIKKKKTQEIKNRRKLSQHNKGIYEKSTANIILNCERLKSFPLRSETRQRSPVLSLLFNMVLEILAREITQVKEIKVNQIRKKEVKLLCS